MRILMLLAACGLWFAAYGPQGAVTTAFKGGGAQDTRDQEKADCIERYRKGQRTTLAGC